MVVQNTSTNKCAAHDDTEQTQILSRTIIICDLCIHKSNST